MMPIRRPFLDYVLSALADAGVHAVCLVIGPEHEDIRRHYAALSTRRLAIDFAIQPKPRGTADAVLAARAFAATDEFLVLNADNYYPPAVVATLIGLHAPGLPGFDRVGLQRYGNIDADRIRQYALLHVDRDGYLVDIVEKPDDSAFTRMDGRALVSMNLWRFSEGIFDACEGVVPSARGELELPGAVRHGIREIGLRFRVVRVEEGVLDLTTRADVAAVADRLSNVPVSL
jgi:glucose-1-phosphate thymidylyltransferase